MLPARRSVEEELDRRVLLIERQRSAVLAAILATIVLGRGIYQLVYASATDGLLGRGYILLVMAVWVGVETLNLISVSRRIRDGRAPAKSHAYLRAAFEVAMPTAMLAILCQYDRPLNVLSSSIPYVYFLIIVLSPLRLAPMLCLFTGALAALGYGTLVAVYTESLGHEWIGSAVIEHLSFVMRSVLLFGGGLAAAFVSQRIRTTIVDMIEEMKERERIVALFGEHVSPVVVRQLLYDSDGEASHVRDVCVMVLDIRNFTTFSEARPPDEVVRHLNTLWTFMVRIVNQHDGIVNKFLGDGFLAVFGAPLSNGSGDCANAMTAAREIMLGARRARDRRRSVPDGDRHRTARRPGHRRQRRVGRPQGVHGDRGRRERRLPHRGAQQAIRVDAAHIGPGAASRRYRRGAHARDDAPRPP